MLATRLRTLPQVRDFTLADLEGHRSGDAADALRSARDRVVGYVPLVGVRLLLADEAVAPVLAALRDPAWGGRGQCQYWITAVGEHGRW